MNSDSSHLPQRRTDRMAFALAFFSASSRPAGKPAAPGAATGGSAAVPKTAPTAPGPSRSLDGRRA